MDSVWKLLLILLWKWLLFGFIVFPEEIILNFHQKVGIAKLIFKGIKNG
jgi:hypothetical protein